MIEIAGGIVYAFVVIVGAVLILRLILAWIFGVSKYDEDPK